VHNADGGGKRMIRARVLICAQKVIVDARTNNASAVNIIEQLNPDVVPSQIPELTTLAVLDRDAADLPTARCTLSFLLNGTRFFAQDIDFTFSDRPRSRNVVDCRGLPLTGSGVLEVVLKLGRRQLASYAITVMPPRLSESPSLQVTTE